MSRFYLIFFLFLLSFASFGQNFVKKYIKFADEQYKKGDYYYALEYYKLALESDSSNIDLLWKYAETHRAYKDYRKQQEVFKLIGGDTEIIDFLKVGTLQKIRELSSFNENTQAAYMSIFSRLLGEE